VIVFTTMERDVRRGRHGIGIGGGKLVGRLRCEFTEQGQTICISGGDSIHTAMSAQVASSPALRLRQSPGSGSGLARKGQGEG
jgi:hypothetical protein